MRNNFSKKNPSLIESEEGFSMIELAAVVAILSILGSLGFTNITKWMKLAQIDEAMSVLNNSLVECLQSTRGGTDPTSVSPPSSSIDNSRLEPAKYKIKNEKDKCSDFFITPIEEDEKILFEMGYQITAAGNVTKISFPADDQSSLQRCKRWAGPNCGASAEQQAAWAAAAALAKAKKDCGDEFYNWLNDTPPNGGTGSFTRWNSNTQSCSLTTYAFEGTIVSNQAAVDAALEQKLGAICTAKVNEQKSIKTTGKTTLSDCPGKTFYFCLGQDKQTENAMNVCIAENEEQTCIANREQARQNDHKGKYGPFTGPGTCGQTFWMCNKIQFTSENDYKSSSCAATVEDTESCLDKEGGRKTTVTSFCIDPGNLKWHPICDNYFECTGEK